MNQWVQQWGAEWLKPLLVTLALPPVPMLLLVLWGAWRIARRRRGGWLLLWSGVLLQWSLSTSAVAEALNQVLLQPPPAFATERSKTADARAPRTAIVVLGGGRAEWAEYGGQTLNGWSMERLRYAIRLSRETGWPLAFSGGLAPGSTGGPSEGELARRIAAEEFGHPLRWVETRSRDTHENAQQTVALLAREGLSRIVLVTHQMHMRRARAHFERAIAAARLPWSVVPAPVAVGMPDGDTTVMDWLPSVPGWNRSRYVLREWLGVLAGA